MNKGALIIVSGPSGSGKDTVLKELFKRMPEIEFSISCVTREKRKDNADEGKYSFVSHEQFEQMIADGALLEYNVYCNNYYGTPKAPVEKCVNSGGEIILEIDVNGAENVRKVWNDCFSVFITPPTFEVLKQRLIGRGTESMDVVEKRMEQAKLELGKMNEFDYILINDDLETAVDDLCNIIKTERSKMHRNADAVERLNKF